MADSFSKRQRERKKMQKQRDKAARKRERTEQGGAAPADAVTWYDLVGEEGGARPWDAGAAAAQGEDVDGMRARLEAERKAQERAAERERERGSGA